MNSKSLMGPELTSMKDLDVLGIAIKLSFSMSGKGLALKLLIWQSEKLQEKSRLKDPSIEYALLAKRTDICVSAKCGE